MPDLLGFTKVSAENGRQPETFVKPKIKQEIVTSVIPAQAGILAKLKQQFVFTIVFLY